MSISSYYDYYSQDSSAQALWRLLQQRTALAAQSTQNTEDTTAIQDLLQTAGSSSQASSGQKVSPLASLVDDGTITSEQEQAIKEALEKARMAFQTQAGSASASSNTAFTDPLDSLVSSGTITEEQKSAVKSVLDAKKPQGMLPPPPPPPSTQSSDEDSDQLSSILDSLVTDGILTEDQESSVLSALKAAFQSNSQTNTGSKTGTAEETDPLDSLVAAGTITEDQKDEIKSAFEEAMSSRRMPPPPQMTQDESSDALMSALNELVNSGTITSDQQQYIQSAFQSAISAYSSQSYPYMSLLNSYETGV